MIQPRPEQLILVGGRTVALPDEVSISEWSLERDNVQNVRIKALLGLIRMLEEALDSNYAILHCSTGRLEEIWRRVGEVAESVRRQLAPLLEEPSVVPRLERARRNVKASYEFLSRSTLSNIDRHSHHLPVDGLIGTRKLLCVSMGEVHAFLQDAFGRLMEADPRSQFNRDYFLSQRFSRDVEEAEWLYRSVGNLADYLHEIRVESSTTVLPIVRRLREEECLPSEASWMTMRDFVNLLRDVTTKLNEMLALRAIRFDEMEILDLYAGELPAKYHQMLALYEAGRAITERVKASAPISWPQREQSIKDLLHAHNVIGRQVGTLAQAIHRLILDLDAFLPIWYRSLGERRALLLYGASIARPETGDRLAAISSASSSSTLTPASQASAS